MPTKIHNDDALSFPVPSRKKVLKYALAATIAAATYTGTFTNHNLSEDEISDHKYGISGGICFGYNTVFEEGSQFYGISIAMITQNKGSIHGFNAGVFGVQNYGNIDGCVLGIVGTRNKGAISGLTATLISHINEGKQNGVIIGFAKANDEPWFEYNFTSQP